MLPGFGAHHEPTSTAGSLNRIPESDKSFSTLPSGIIAFLPAQN